MAVKPRSLKELLLFAENNTVDGVGFIPGVNTQEGPKQFKQRGFGYGAGGGKFGFDSQPPFIITDLPKVGSESTGYVIEDPSTLDVVDDLSNNFVRGGAVTLAKRAFNDVERLGKLLFSPSGLAWSAAQLALARTNPIGPIPESDPEAAADPDKNKFVQAIQRGVEKVKNKFPRNQVTLPLNLVLSAGVSAGGVRFRKDGLLDAKFESGYNYDPTRGGDKYENITVNNAKIINENALESNKNFNRLLNIYGKHILSADLEPNMESVKIDSKKRRDFANNYLLEYGGGAHSLFGVGRTAIKKYRSNPYDTSEAQGYTPAFNSNFFELRQGPSSSELLKDYRDLEVDPNAKDHLKLGPSVSSKSRNILYKLGDPGVKIDESNERAYSVKINSAIDILTANKVFTRENLVAENIPKDYIKFRIAVVDTDNPLNDNVILFRAFLDSLSDNYTGNWNSYKYNGRAEEFYTYEGFNRGIDFGFKIHAQTRSEQRPLWEKLNYLVAQTAPEYKNRRMRGVFSRLTIGDWISEIPGFFTSVNLSWQTNYPWEIKLDNDLDSDVDQYPHILDVSCNFQPIHDFAPSNSISTPFIFKGGTIAENTEIAKPSLEEKTAPIDL